MRVSRLALRPPLREHQCPTWDHHPLAPCPSPELPFSTARQGVTIEPRADPVCKCFFALSKTFFETPMNSRGYVGSNRRVAGCGALYCTRQSDGHVRYVSFVQCNSWVGGTTRRRRDARTHVRAYCKTCANQDHCGAQRKQWKAYAVGRLGLRRMSARGGINPLSLDCSVTQFARCKSYAPPQSTQY